MDTFIFPKAHIMKFQEVIVWKDVFIL